MKKAFEIFGAVCGLLLVGFAGMFLLNRELGLAIMEHPVGVPVLVGMEVSLFIATFMEIRKNRAKGQATSAIRLR